jgi:hypothetical protein
VLSQSQLHSSKPHHFTSLLHERRLFGAFQPIIRVMTPQTSGTLSGNSLEQVLRAETENRAWGKTLRQRATALLNSRLANAISFEEYTAFRQQAGKDATECRQQGRILGDEIRSRNDRYVPRANPEMNAPPKYTSKARSEMKSVVKRSQIAAPDRQS